jgi:DNA-binding winged helix-turn-helix (wHTH) protein
LLRDERSIPLSPKVFETLIFLIQHRGGVVKKDDIMSAVWPDTFVEEGNLAQNIFLLRKALGFCTPSSFGW